MALRWDWKGLMGKVTIKQKGKSFDVNIYNGNALAIFICEYEQNGEERYIMYDFFTDSKHCENIVKNEGKLFSDEVVDIQLNMWYLNAQKLLKILVKNGYMVSCYYEERKEK